MERKKEREKKEIEGEKKKKPLNSGTMMEDSKRYYWLSVWVWVCLAVEEFAVPVTATSEKRGFVWCGCALTIW